MIFSCLLLLLTAVAQSDAPTASPRSSEVPKLLERAFLQRISYKTASFRIREEYARSGWATTVNNREMKWAGDSLWCRDEGDDDGMLRYSNARTGEVPLGIAMMFLPEERVFDAETRSMWARNCNSVFTTKASRSMWLEYVDVRSIGLRSTVMRDTDPKRMLDLLDGLTFERSLERDGLTIIRAVGPPSSDQSQYEFEWVVDKDKGPSVVCARQFIKSVDGRRELSSEAKMSVVQVSGVWWPSRVEFKYAGNSGQRTFDFQRIEFNESHHPSKIDADTLGLPIGAPVYVPGRPGSERYLGAGKIVDDAKWKTMKSTYDLGPYKTFSNNALSLGRGEFPSWWNSTDGSEGLADVADRPDLWEAYVRRWVMRRTNNRLWHVIEPLADAQRTTANGILDDCRNKAVPIRTRLDKEAAAVAADLVAAEAALTTARLASNKASNGEKASGADVRKTALDFDAKKEKVASEDELAAKIKTLQQRRTELAKSPEIERLFDELKARLEGMLTTKQRDPGNASFQRPTPPPPPRNSSLPPPKPAGPAAVAPKP